MKRLKIPLIAATLLGACAASAAPTVSEPTIAVGPDGVVKIDYALSGEPAVVTADVLTNGVTIGAAHLGGFVGDVNREMAVGDHTIYWCPRNYWPNERIADGSLKVRLTAWAKANPPDYMAQSIHQKDLRFFYPTAEEVPWGVTNRAYKTNLLLMRRIHAAGVSWTAGLSVNDEGYDSSTSHQGHVVTLTNDYYIGVYETTLTQHKMVWGGVDNLTDGLSFGSGSSQFTNETVFAYPDSFVRPIDSLSWCRLRAGTTSKLSAFCWPQMGHAVSGDQPIGSFRTATGLELDLPTEAQWEYAARAGNGDSVPEDINAVAWTMKNWTNDPMRIAYGNANQTHEVGLLQPNDWGLYDMLGNSAEWCLDAWPAGNNDPYKGAEVIEPVGPTSSDARIQRNSRGGAYTSSAVSTLGPCVRWRWGVTQYKLDGGVRYVCPAVLP